MIEVEVSRANTDWHFRPLQRTVRGVFDMSKLNDPQAKIAASNWPLPIPGQRLGIDREGIGYLEEPLHQPANAVLVEKITQRGQGLEPALQTFPNIDQNTWFFWIARAIESGLCRIVKGELPPIDRDAARKDFVNAPPKPGTTDKLTAAIEAQTAAFNQLTAAITQLVASK